MTGALIATALATLCAVDSNAQTLNLASTQLPQADGGSTTIFYPTRAAESAITRGPFQISWAGDAKPERGNSVADHLLSDPPAFDRADALPRLNGKIAEFFEKALPGQ